MESSYTPISFGPDAVVPLPQRLPKNRGVDEREILAAGILLGLLLGEGLPKLPHNMILEKVEEISHTPDKWHQLVQQIAGNSSWLLPGGELLSPPHKDIKAHWLDMLQRQLAPVQASPLLRGL